MGSEDSAIRFNSWIISLRSFWSSSDFVRYLLYTQNAFGEVMEVRAYMAVNMLDDRIVMATERIRALKHEEDLYRIYDRNRRGLPFLYSPLSGLVNNYLECETTWDSVLEIFKKICSHNQ